MHNESSKSDKPSQPEERRSQDPLSRRHVLAAVTPLLLVITIAVIYWLTSSAFIQCKWGLVGCQKLTVASAYLNNEDTLHKYPTDKLQPVSAIEPQLQNKIQEKKEVDAALEKVIWESDGVAKQLADPAKLSAEENSRLTAKKKDLDSLVSALTPRQTKLAEQVKALQDQLSGIHNRQSKIYWSRAMYATFVALFVMVSLASVIVAAYIIFNTLSKDQLVAVLAVLLMSACVGIGLYVTSEQHMMVVNEITSHIKDAGNINPLTNVLNSFGYAATTTLVFAVTTLLLFPAQIVNSEEEFENNVKLLSTRMKYLRAVLYVGTGMLIITIFRMKAGLDWSVASLVQSDTTSAESFNMTLITAQGSFYTLLLAAVYSPAAYTILKTANLLPTADITKKNETLSSKGLAMTAPSIREYLPRLGVMLLPFLVGPIAELAKHIFV